MEASCRVYASEIIIRAKMCVCVCKGGVVFVWEGAVSVCENKNWQYKILHNNSATAMILGPDKSKG